MGCQWRVCACWLGSAAYDLFWVQMPIDVMRGLPQVLGSPRQAGIFRSVFELGEKRGVDFAAG
jgi:hypothetical protein